MENKLFYDVEDKPKFGRMLIFALQQVLAILAATILVPQIIGLPAQMPSAILGAGVGTLVYQLFTKRKSPVFLGSSFAFLNSLGVAVAYGYCGIILGSIVAGLVYVVIAAIIKLTGTGWINKLMPSVIIGPTVALIGLSLAGNAMGDLVKANGTVLTQTLENGDVVSLFGGYNLVGMLCGLLAFVTIIVCSTQKRYQMPRLIPFIIGIAVGYGAAAIFTVIGNAANIDYLRIVNFQPIVENFVVDGKFRGITAIVDYPRFALIEAINEITTGNMKLSGGSVVEIIVAFLPVALVVFA